MTGPVVYPAEFCFPCGTLVPGEWRWDPAAPTKFLLTFSGVTWVMGRDLLTAGIQGPVGDGDVVLVPVADVDELCREVDDLTCALIALRRLVADMTSPPRRFATVEEETQ